MLFSILLLDQLKVCTADSLMLVYHELLFFYTV